MCCWLAGKRFVVGCYVWSSETSAVISPPPCPEKQLTLHICGLLLTRDGTLLLLLSPSAAAHHLFLFHSVEVGAALGLRPWVSCVVEREEARK